MQPSSSALTISDPSRFSTAITREWVETNGLGGWASSTVPGAHTRRYHGLLVAALNPPVDRRVLLSRVDEIVEGEHERFELASSIFPGVVHPEGHTFLTQFTLSPFPTSTYQLADITLRRTVGMLHGEDTIVVLYELLRATEPIRLALRPLFAGRDYHHLVRANDDVFQDASFADGVLTYQSYAGQPTVHLALPGAHFTPAPDWYYNYEYPREAERGLDFSEDLFTPGLLRVALEPGACAALVASTEDPSGRDPRALLSDEATRRSQLSIPAALTESPGPELVRAADQFLVRRGQDQYTITAGYHWFTDWGRDTMISLPGICLVTGRFSEAAAIFRAYAAHVSEGMIPNRFPDAGEHPDYNTVDASLWFAVALYRYLQYTGDDDFVRDQVWPVLQDIISWHRDGTRYGIHVDEDGLLSAGAEGVQLTWMDAKVGDWVVTPRLGQAVEINALWYNALRIAADLAQRYGRGDGGEYGRLAAQVAMRFPEVFWNEEEGCLYDVVDGDLADGAVRPNQIFALSLPFPLLGADEARRVLARVEDDLLTPRGLRSLSPRDPAYHPTYSGSPLERDGAYHQGTVWAWLMGPYITALVRYRGEDGQRQGRRLISGFRSHLTEAGIGTVSEIFDGDAPHSPRGCISQAWSVAELLRAWYEDVLGQGPEPQKLDGRAVSAL